MQRDRISILIADDNKDFVTLLCSCLSMHSDMEVAGVARNGAEVLSQIERFHPDVLLLDLVMPSMDGLEVLSQLHVSKEKGPAVFVLSGISSEQIIRRTKELGAVFYFIKPCNTEVIVEKIRSVMTGTDEKAVN